MVSTLPIGSCVVLDSIIFTKPLSAFPLPSLVWRAFVVFSFVLCDFIPSSSFHLKDSKYLQGKVGYSLIVSSTLLTALQSINICYNELI